MRNNESYRTLLRERIFDEACRNVLRSQITSTLNEKELLSSLTFIKKGVTEELRKTINEQKQKTDEFIFVIGGEDYKKYTQWRLEIETKINQQELETGKRAIDGEKLSQDDLDNIRQCLEKGEPKVLYGGYIFHHFDGHKFNFHLNNSTYSVTVLNQLTKDTIKLGEGYFYRFSDYYQKMNSLIPEVKLTLIDELALKLFNRSKIDPLEKDFEIYEKWQELTDYHYTSDGTYDRLIFRIDSEQYKEYQTWRDEKKVTDCYFSFERTNLGSLDSVVDSITGERIDLTGDDW